MLLHIIFATFAELKNGIDLTDCNPSCKDNFRNILKYVKCKMLKQFDTEMYGYSATVAIIFGLPEIT